MNNQSVKKVSLLALAGFMCALGIGTPQVTAAKQETSTQKAINPQNPSNSLPEVKIGQLFIAPELNLKKNTYVLDYKNSDVTGDSVEDKVILTGTKEKIEGSLDAYASNLSVVVQDGKTKGYVKHDWLARGTDGTWYGELGREPNLIIGDYTGDKVDDIIVTAPQGGNGGYVDHLVLAWQENNLKAIFADNQEPYTNPKGKL